MTIDLKWLLPFTAPFVVATFFRALCWFTGATYEPDIAAAFATVLGLALSVLGLLFIAQTGPVWPVRIGKKGGK